MQSNSTEALLQLWHMCVKSQGSDVDAESEGPVLQWETLRKVMAGLPMARQDALRSTPDEILQRHFGAARHRQRYVNFTLFWRGMEAILQSAGVFNNSGFSEEMLQVIASLRHFRDLLLELDAATTPVAELRRLYGRLQQMATSAVVANYWTLKLQELHQDAQTVSADEIAFALLKWLEELLGCDASEASEDEFMDEPEQERQPEAAALRLATPQEATSSGWSWLGRASTPEVTSFRQRMLRLLPREATEDHVLLHFYRAVRDALDAGQIGSPCSHERLRVTRASLRGGVALLERVALREVRVAFRQLQRAMRRPSLVRGDSAIAPRPSTPRSEGCGIMAGLVCSQALAAQVLDRRANLAPRAFYMAWLLERARRRCLVSVLSILRHGARKKVSESPTRRLVRPQPAVPKQASSSPSRLPGRSKTPPTKTAIV
ncbi:unnamed protein product [Cladocopium goreaui]|uniref:Uncharacterized protein n=1 Tax=Cladocopium goreaui TaxID=2562237 RepID=A0A9P1GC49_9DINO|nr:unnamed protein product [Cladocopium goreaui]